MAKEVEMAETALKNVGNVLGVKSKQNLLTSGHVCQATPVFPDYRPGESKSSYSRWRQGA